MNTTHKEIKCTHESAAIMHVVNFFDSRLGYAEYYIAKQQLENGFDTCIVASDNPILGNEKWRPGLGTVDGIKVFYLKGALKIRGNVFLFNPLMLKTAINLFSPDLIHCHGLLSPLSQEVLALKNSKKYKIVGDLITGVSPLALTLLPSFRPILNSWLLRRTDAFFACNKAIEKYLLQTLKIPQSKVHFIPLGADTRLFRPDRDKRKKTRDFLGLLPDDIVAIYTGKIQPSKCIHDLLRASKVIVDQKESFKILLVGDGDLHYQKELRILIGKLGINNNVTFVRTVHRKKLPDFYNAADLAVWPGSFSISIIEAMACGLPTILAESDWTSHYLEYENGFSFRAGDVTTLTSLLLELVQDNGLRRFMGDRGRRLVEDKLNWDKISNQYIDIYEKVVDHYRFS